MMEVGELVRTLGEDLAALRTHIGRLVILLEGRSAVLSQGEIEALIG